MAALTSTKQIPLEKAREMLRYDPESGDFYWLVSRGRMAAGMKAGVIKGDSGYVSIRIDGEMYYGHRLAWVMHTGQQIPDGMEIDHRNGDTGFNAFRNLRLATPMQNKRNMIPSKRNTSGHAGVTFRKSRGKWQAQMSVGNAIKYLGSFDRKEDAIAARRKAEAEIFGKFSYSERNAV